ALSSTGTLTGTDPRGRRFVGGAVLAFRLPTNHPHRGACAADLARGRSRARPYACADCRAAGGRQGLPDRLLGSYLLSASTIASQLELRGRFLRCSSLRCRLCLLSELVLTGRADLA